MVNVLGIGLLALLVAVIILFIVVICQQRKIKNSQTEMARLYNDLNMRIGWPLSFKRGFYSRGFYSWPSNPDKRTLCETVEHLTDYLDIEWYKKAAKYGYRKKKHAQLVKCNKPTPKAKKKSK